MRLEVSLLAGVAANRPPETLRVFSTNQDWRVETDQRRFADFLADSDQSTVGQQYGPMLEVFIGGIALIVIGGLMMREAWGWGSK